MDPQFISEVMQFVSAYCMARGGELRVSNANWNAMHHSGLVINSLSIDFEHDDVVFNTHRAERVS